MTQTSELKCVYCNANIRQHPTAPTLWSPVDKAFPSEVCFPAADTVVLHRPQEVSNV